MTDQDRPPKIRRLRPETRRIDGLPADEYNDLVRAYERDHAEVERLKGLLRQLEWACDEPDVGGRCPACRGMPPLEGLTYSHAPSCWLAAELA